MQPLLHRQVTQYRCGADLLGDEAVIETGGGGRGEQAGESKKGRDLTYGLSFARTVLRTWWR